VHVYLHIGTEKTGTTTIQAFLEATRDVMQDKGLCYLRSAGSRGHSSLVAYCLRHERSDAFFLEMGLVPPACRQEFRNLLRERLAAELTHTQNAACDVLVSSEHFHSRLEHEDEIAALRDLFAPHCEGITVITYLRPQIETALSCYSTALKCGHAVELLDHVQANCTPDSCYYNYDIYLQKWERVFGRENLRVRLFDQREFSRGELLVDFMEQTGVRLSQEAAASFPHQNRSVDPFGQSLLRAVNRHLPRRGAHTGALSLELMRLISARTAGLGAGLDARTRQRVQARFDASNEQVRQRYFPHRELLFAPQEDRAPRQALPPAQEDLLAEVIGMLARALERREAEESS